MASPSPSVWNVAPWSAASSSPQFQVVVDLAVEHQHVAVGRVGGAPAQRLMAVRDVDDRQPVEAEHDLAVVPGARLVGTAVPHQVRRAGHRVDQVGGDVGGRVESAGPAVRTPRQYAE